MSLRHERVRELLKRQIGEVIRREFSMEEVGVVTVNEVGVSSDLHSARVFVGLIGNDEQRKRALGVLHKERKRIQFLVGKEVILKYTPHLQFVADDSVTKGNRVLDILNEIEKEHPFDEGAEQQES